ncbi:hypothetical protein Btru_057451 [Bulinus truncatus]|nr:hypothetical protein Btru_057451 [Bulinus truncatus]
MLCCYKWVKPNNNDWKEWLRTWREATYIPASYEAGHLLIGDPWLSSYDVQENLLEHQMCCANSTRTKFCGRFYKLFPDRGCSNFVPYVLASAFGDPHLGTLDGVTYTMNGLNEFTLLEVPDEEFFLQARTGRAERIDGTLTNATVFTAFAAKESKESRFQVELSSSKASMIIMVNEIDITNEFYKSGGSEILIDTDSITITREYTNNKTLITASFLCGVSLKIQVASKSLLIELDVLKELHNKTRGLLGNFNGDRSDEFTLPNGTVLPSNISEREIYEQFAKTWVVTDANSVFLYKDGESAETYQHLDFVPTYGDEAGPADKVQAIKICGATNVTCIFDYMVTKDKSFAQSTREFNSNLELTKIDLENFPPTINVENDTLDVNGRWLVRQGIPSYLQVITQDDNGDTVTLELLSNSAGVSVNQSGIIKYIPDITKTIKLRLRARDSKGSYSPILNIPVTICPSCNSLGSCDSNIIRKEVENGLFQVLTCNCQPAFTGTNCESELNACELRPCFKGQTCTDLTAAQQGNNTVGLKCGPCPSGYVDAFNTCVDIDECNDTLVLCDQTCTNTEGSYRCICNDGYRFDYAERKCRDVDECKEGTSSCEQICVNSEGSYTCSCHPGYTLDDNSHTCTLDQSKIELCYSCAQVCVVDNGYEATCNCKLGYEADPEDSNSCVDIDECQTSYQTCSHTCTNTPGKYECSCPTGFKMSTDKVTCLAFVVCEACEMPFYGEDCSNTCQCNGRGTCDPVEGCQCDGHWMGEHCEIDVDECTRPDICSQGLVCVNTVGSFKCACPDGYQLLNGLCIDIDECTDPSVSTACDPSLEVCVNSVGSYSCLCITGYARFNQFSCSDVDECTTGTDQCQQICDNKPDTYNCDCYNGFKLDDNRFTCSVDRSKDPCAYYNGTCSHGCRLNSNNEPECFCPRGFQLLDTGVCHDINECLNDTDNRCSNKNSCINSNGSYSCSCLAGMMLDNDARTCIGVHCETDIDECATKQLLCNENEKCVNHIGSASCECLTGYEKVNESCKATGICTSKICSFNCTKINGVETCSCPIGKKLSKDGINCEDCTEGRWGVSCQSLCTCVSDLTVNCNKVSGNCQCKTGWTGTRCDQDINECAVGSFFCPSNAQCKNTFGGYECPCYDGYILKDGHCSKKTDYSMSVKMAYNVTGRNLENKTADDFLELKDEVENKLTTNFINKSVDLLSLTVNDLRKGSLIVDFNVVIMIEPDTCRVRQRIHPCKDPDVCMESGGTTRCRSEDSDDRTLMLGLTIGIPLAALAISVTVLIIVCYLKGHNKKFVNAVSTETLQPSLKMDNSQSGSTRKLIIPQFSEPKLGNEKVTKE